MTVLIKHATLAADRPLAGIGESMWDQDHSVPEATQAEAEAGAANDKVMTPLRTAQAIAALGAGGAPGADGASAYEVAVANGFVGTEAAWLASLVGADGDSVTITTFTDEALFNAATAGPLELLVLTSA